MVVGGWWLRVTTIVPLGFGPSQDAALERLLKRAYVEESYSDSLQASVALSAARILLWTQPTMASAQRLYVRCGFQRVPELDFSRGGREFLVFARSG
jgi:hypothetical protein